MWGQKDLIHNYLQSWGTIISGAFQDPVYNIYSTPEIRGFIGYRIEVGCAVVFGEPICAPEDMPKMIDAFYHYCKENSLEVIYLIVPKKCANLAAEHCKTMIEFGEELYINPDTEDPTKRGHGGLVRNKLKHAEKEGIILTEYIREDPLFESRLEKFESDWIKSRKGPQVFMSHAYIFANKQNRRWFYAEHKGNIIGLLMLDRLESQAGWIVCHLICSSKAPQGTSESLVVFVIQQLAQEKCRYLSFGVVPLSKLGEIKGLNKISIWLAGIAFKIANKLFKLEYKKMFWHKFLPQSHAYYLLIEKPGISIKALKALKRALNMELT